MISHTNRVSRWILFSLVVGMLVFLVGPSVAEELPTASSTADLQRRVEELESLVRQLMAERQKDAPNARHSEPGAPPLPPAETGAEPTEPAAGGDDEATAVQLTPDGPGAAPPAPAKAAKGEGKTVSTAGWSDRFFIRSADKKFNLNITGQIQADYRGFLGHFDQTNIDTFLVRRARLGIEANILEAYEFRLLPDFGSGVARVQDAYLNVHYWDEFQIETGKFKEPFSYEQLIQDRYVPTLERSLIDQLAPARDEGLMVHGRDLFDKRLDYAAGVFNGVINGEADTNDRKDVAGRVAFRPFAPNSREWLRYFQVGISATTGVEQEPANPRTLRTPSTIPWFQFNAAVQAAGLRNRYSPEASYFYGPFGIAAQYFYQEQDFRPSPTTARFINVPFEGWYVLTTMLLTGEERTTYSQPIDPIRPFEPQCHRCGCGAWELVGRVSRLNVGRQVFAPGILNLADPSLFSSGCTEMTLGFNWYLNKYVRMQFNWEHAWYDNPIRLGLGPDGLFKFTDALLTRFQVIF